VLAGGERELGAPGHEALRRRIDRMARGDQLAEAIATARIGGRAHRVAAVLAREVDRRERGAHRGAGDRSPTLVGDRAADRSARLAQRIGASRQRRRAGTTTVGPWRRLRGAALPPADRDRDRRDHEPEHGGVTLHAFELMRTNSPTGVHGSRARSPRRSPSITTLKQLAMTAA